MTTAMTATTMPLVTAMSKCTPKNNIGLAREIHKCSGGRAAGQQLTTLTHGSCKQVH